VTGVQTCALPIFVDLPAPFLPINAILSLGLITKLTSLKSVRALNSTVRPFTEIINTIF